jgi:RNA polymerase sigma-70 factor (ECF subfamily)
LILRDVLGWSAAEVAELLETTVVSVNSLLQRARATIDRHLPTATPAASGPDERELLSRYIEAFERDDVDGLVALLREDALLRMPPQRSLTGAFEIARFFRDVAGHGDLASFRLMPTSANGRPAVVIYRRAADRRLIPHGVSVLQIEGEQIGGIDTFIDPALLQRFGFPTVAYDDEPGQPEHR